MVIGESSDAQQTFGDRACGEENANFSFVAYSQSRRSHRDQSRFILAFGLRTGHGRAENGAVRTTMRLAALAVAVLGVCLAGTAQYQDRDTRGVAKTSASAPPPEARVDINHADLKELLKVPGMTPSWAGRIVRFRPYRTKQDLVERGVVTSEVYNRIKDFVIAHQKAE
jgi:DNA uptake protein ComE-like DNA-binding protein